MAESTGIVVTAGVITFGNDWVQTGKPNWRIAMGTLGTALVFAGLEKLDEQAAVGLAVIVMITVLLGGVTPGVKSPAQEVLSLMGKK
jgi:hypothetical protein